MWGLIKFGFAAALIATIWNGVGSIADAISNKQHQQPSFYAGSLNGGGKSKFAQAIEKINKNPFGLAGTAHAVEQANNKLYSIRDNIKGAVQGDPIAEVNTAQNNNYVSISGLTVRQEKPTNLCDYYPDSCNKK